MEHQLRATLGRFCHVNAVNLLHALAKPNREVRDALRAQPEPAPAYAALKPQLASRDPDDREADSAAKTAFVEQVLAQAR